jgi:putative hemolysin
MDCRRNGHQGEKIMKLITNLAVLAIAGLMCVCAGAAQAEDAGFIAKASAYCTAKGGVVQEREPYYGTNGNSALQLAGKQYFCQFTSQKDGSQISLLLRTLYTKMPSLAALAYYAEVQYNENCNGSPGSCYCSQLGGTDLFGGVNAAGGGWVLVGNSSDVLDTCMFPDMSSIDSYGLFYHSANIIRGKNLAKVLRYPNPY